MFFSKSESKSKSKQLKQATIEFTESKKMVIWTESDGFIIDIADEAGIPALSNCRSGFCGTCAVELLSGEVSYDQEVSAEINEKQILLCSAIPATSHIKIKV